MIYRDRIDAGRKLAEALKAYAKKAKTLIVALPRGGVVVGHEVAALLHLPLDIVCPRKIGAPFHEELAIGAVTETGEAILSRELIRDLFVSQEFIKKALETETKNAQWRLNHYRSGRPPRDLKGKTVILVDDGLATGATMRAAIKTVRAELAKEIILAIPVAPPDTLAKLSREVNHVICLESPLSFFAVGQFYEHFDQTTDAEVIQLLQSD